MWHVNSFFFFCFFFCHGIKYCALGTLSGSMYVTNLQIILWSSHAFHYGHICTYLFSTFVLMALKKPSYFGSTRMMNEGPYMHPTALHLCRM